MHFVIYNGYRTKRKHHWIDDDDVEYVEMLHGGNRILFSLVCTTCYIILSWFDWEWYTIVILKIKGNILSILSSCWFRILLSFISWIRFLFFFSFLNKFWLIFTLLFSRCCWTKCLHYDESHIQCLKRMLSLLIEIIAHMYAYQFSLYFCFRFNQIFNDQFLSIRFFAFMLKKNRFRVNE